MTWKQRLQNWWGILLMLLLLSVCFFVAFVLMKVISLSYNFRPPEPVHELFSLLLGSFFFYVVIRIALLFDKSAKPLFSSIIDTQEQIAKGKFDVSLDKTCAHNGPVEELVDSVNHMALELGKLERMRQAFIANVSHEIQSPLTSIRGFAQRLRNEDLQVTDRSRYLDIIEAESMRLSRLSDSLLKLAALEADTMACKPQTYRLDKQLRTVILSAEPKWQEKQLELDLTLRQVEVLADGDLMSQVWTNLLHNSIKFTPTGGSIKMEIIQLADQIQVTISDTGTGIAKADISFIFDRFYKGDAARTPSTKGSGLGLAIVKKIIELHQGSIEVKSQLDVGTQVVVSIPNKESL